jgi:glycosyltransferase involved in cell wall biosynthesis
MPFFSVIIPTFNRDRLLSKALLSVLQQTFSDWECLIIDDGSTDSTKELVMEFSTNEHRIKYFYQENTGRSAARNKGFELAKGEYICFLDSDDHYLPDYLQKLSGFIQQKKKPVVFIFSNIIYESSQGQRIIKYKEPAGNPLDYLLKNTIGTIQGCLHKAILKEFQFDQDLKIGEDLALWMKVGDKYPVYYLETNSVIANIHEGRSVNKNNNPGLEELKTLRKIIKENRFQKNKLSHQLVRRKLSNCLASIGFSYYLSAANARAAFYLARSIIKDVNNPQTKFRLHSILTLVPIINLLLRKDKILDSIS